MAEGDGTELGIFFDFDGKCVGARVWAELQRSPQRVVATTHFANIRVSTVWVGIDSGLAHVLCRGCPPLIYETIVWKPHTDPPEFDTWVTSEWEDQVYHWPSRKLATSGHWRIVARLRADHMAESDQPR